MFPLKQTEEIEIFDALFDEKGVRVCVKREDQLDDFISGNKYRKLKYNLVKAKSEGHKKLLTFGGAYSNHIHALAYAGHKFNFETIGIIRGERIEPLNPTLSDAEKFGMTLKFIDRSTYKSKLDPKVVAQFKEEFGDFYLVPEGGSNVYAVEGCEEIIDQINFNFDFICCACGTGGTLAGIICGLKGQVKALGFPVLKGGGFLSADIEELIFLRSSKKYTNWRLMLDYHFGGYAKYEWDLIHFINEFKEKHHIPLDPIYTGKMMFGVFDLIKKDFFPPGSRILAIHTGGLQGIRGFNERFGELIK